MSTSSLPKVALDMTNGGRPSVKVDGVEMSHVVTAVAVRAEARRPVSVTLDVFGDFAMPEQEAEVLIRVLGLRREHFKLGQAADNAPDGATARAFRAVQQVIEWLATTDRPQPLVGVVKDALGVA